MVELRVTSRVTLFTDEPEELHKRAPPIAEALEESIKRGQWTPFKQLAYAEHALSNAGIKVNHDCKPHSTMPSAHFFKLMKSDLQAVFSTIQWVAPPPDQPYTPADWFSTSLLAQKVRTAIGKQIETLRVAAHALNNLQVNPNTVAYQYLKVPRPVEADDGNQAIIAWRERYARWDFRQLLLYQVQEQITSLCDIVLNWRDRMVYVFQQLHVPYSELRTIALTCDANFDGALSNCIYLHSAYGACEHAAAVTSWQAQQPHRNAWVAACNQVVTSYLNDLVVALKTF